MKLPSTKKILREDVKEAPPWVNGLIDPINSFMESVYLTLNKNISLGDNVASFIKELSYKTIATYPTGQENVEFLNTLRTKPIGVMVMQVYEKTSYTPAAGPVYVPWIEDQGSIIVYPITGLEPDRSYLVRLVIF